MRTTTAALTIAALIPITAIAAGQSQAAPCAGTMTFAISGVDGNPAHVPGVTGPRTNIHYRSDLHSVVTDPIGTRLSGERALSRSINSYRARCPGSHVRVAGFSYGAWIAGNVRDSRRYPNSSYVLISDPRAANGILRLAPRIPGYFEPQGKRRKPAAPTATTCRTNDAVCFAPNPAVDPVGFANSVHGYFTGAHGYTNGEVRQAPGSTVIRGPQNIRAVEQQPVYSAPVEVVADFVPEPIVQYVPPQIADIPVPQELAPVLRQVTDLIPQLPKF